MMARRKEPRDLFICLFALTAIAMPLVTLYMALFHHDIILPPARFYIRPMTYEYWLWFLDQPWTPEDIALMSDVLVFGQVMIPVLILEHFYVLTLYRNWIGGRRIAAVYGVAAIAGVAWYCYGRYVAEHYLLYLHLIPHTILSLALAYFIWKGVKGERNAALKLE